nr:uncharacterized mitochondrial protein AtMg00810-like [Tanacetum cinerariifolium]
WTRRVLEESGVSLLEALSVYLDDFYPGSLSCVKVREEKDGDHLGKFDGKADEGFFIGYSINSKVFRVLNSRTRIVEENLHIRFSESTPNVVDSEPDWLFDIDALTRTMNYEPIVADPKSSNDGGSKPLSDDGKKVDEDKKNECNDQEKEDNINNTNNVNNSVLFQQQEYKDHPLDQVIGDLQSATQTRRMSKNLEEHRKIKEEVYVCQPPGFEDPDFPDRVYKVEKALYGLQQGPRAWFTGVKATSTSMETQKPLLKDEDGEEVDVHSYRSMIGSLMYLTSSRPDIMFASFACARYQVNPKASYFYDVKMIFRYLKGQPKLGLWYPKDSPFDLIAYTNSDYAGGSLDKKSTTGDGKEIVITESSVRRDLQLADEKGKGFSIKVTPLFQTTVIQNQSELGEVSTMPTDPHHTPTILQPSSQPQKKQQPRKPKRKDTQVSQPSGSTKTVVDEAVHKELGDSLETPNESSSEGTNSGDGPRCQETIGDTIAQTRVLDLEKTMTTQRNKIDSLKRRVKKLEKRKRSRNHRLKRLYKFGLSARVESSGDEESLGEDASKHGRRIDAINADEDITLVGVQDDVDKEMFDVDVLGNEEVFVAAQIENVVEEVVNAAQVSTAVTTVIITTEEFTLAQALEALKSLKPKVKRIVFHEPGKSTTTKTISSQQSEDNGKGIMIEEPVKPKKKDQIILDEEAAKKLHVEFDKKERLTREKDEKEEIANIALIETWDDIQVKIDVDHQFAERLQAQEQEELSNAEKNIEGYKLKDLKLKEFDSIQEMFDKAFRRVNTFENFRTELVEGKETRAGIKLEQEITKKQKVKDDKEKAELKQLMETILDEEEVAIDVITLVVKSPRIVDWKIHTKRKEKLL